MYMNLFHFANIAKINQDIQNFFLMNKLPINENVTNTYLDDVAIKLEKT